MKALVMTAVLTVNALIAVANNGLEGFAYNQKTNSHEQITSETVYKVNDGSYLKHHMQYEYAYDETGRLISKEALKWNEATAAYEPAYRLDISYLAEGVELRYARWDAKVGAYAAASEKTLYRQTTEGVDYLSYLWCEQTGSWNLEQEHNFDDDRLLAVE